jgi:hypothetical protein
VPRAPSRQATPPRVAGRRPDREWRTLLRLCAHHRDVEVAGVERAPEAEPEREVHLSTASGGDTTAPSSRRYGRSPRRAMQQSLRSRSPGPSRVATTSSRSSAPDAANGSRRHSARSTSSSRQTIWRRSRRRSRPTRSPASGTRPSRWPFSTASEARVPRLSRGSPTGRARRATAVRTLVLRGLERKRPRGRA